MGVNERNKSHTSGFVTPHFNKSRRFLYLIAFQMHGSSFLIVMPQPRLKQDPSSPSEEMFW